MGCVAGSSVGDTSEALICIEVRLLPCVPPHTALHLMHLHCGLSRTMKRKSYGKDPSAPGLNLEFDRYVPLSCGAVVDLLMHVVCCRAIGVA